MTDEKKVDCPGGRGPRNSATTPRSTRHDGGIIQGIERSDDWSMQNQNCLCQYKRNKDHSWVRGKFARQELFAAQNPPRQTHTSLIGTSTIVSK